MKDINLSNETYDKLSYLALIGLPLIATFYAGLGTLWGFPKTTEVVGTITLVATLLGGLLKISSKQYQNREPDEGE